MSSITSIDTVYEALIAWIRQVTSLKVIRADDPESAAPRPNADGSTDAYASIKVDRSAPTSSTAYEELVEGDPAGTYDRHLSQVRDGTLLIELYGPGAEDYAFALDLSRDDPNMITLINSYGDISLGAVSDTADDPILRSAEREPNASLSVNVQWTHAKVLDDQPVVEDIDSTAKVTDVDGTELVED